MNLAVLVPKQIGIFHFISQSQLALGPLSLLSDPDVYLSLLHTLQRERKGSLYLVQADFTYVPRLFSWYAA